MSLDSVAVSPESRRSEAARSPFHRIGIAGLLLAVFAVILEVSGIAIGSGGAWSTATVIAWLVTGFQVVSGVLGLVAMVIGHGRRCGLAAVVLSLLANPLLLVGVFSLMRGFS